MTIRLATPVNIVSIHAPARGATPAGTRSPRRRPRFNPRPRAGGDERWKLPVAGADLFQSTPPRGGRQLEPQATVLLNWFQSTPPRGGRLRLRRIPMRGHCFNPRPRAGGDVWALGQLSGASVSIHAPARGATGTSGHYYCSQCVSIHAPARGATLVVRSEETAPPVSIHAPARGATSAVSAGARAGKGFNPRPRAGGDAEPGGWVCRRRLFQSTPPRGGRRGRAGHADEGGLRFNPRPRAGGDRKAEKKRDTGGQFQSTPPRGGRLARVSLRAWSWMFQSTPPRGGRPNSANGWPSLSRVSIHAPARGATMRLMRSRNWGKFQSTPPRGGRLPRAPTS